MTESEPNFEKINRIKNLKENETVLGLRESEKLIGQLYPVLVDEEGNVLDGQHRLKVNPNWRKEVVKGLDSERKKAMVRLHANWHRRQHNSEQIIKELAKVTEWKGAAEYAAFLGCSLRTVQRYLPQQYKMRRRVCSKRQLSLSEQKEMPSYEVELFEKLQNQELESYEGYRVVTQLQKGNETYEWDQGKALDFLANRLYNNVSRRKEPPEELLSRQDIRDKCEFYLKILELRKTPQDKIMAFLEDAQKKQIEDIQRIEHAEYLRKQYKEKLEELGKSVTKLILVLNDDSQIEFERSQIPKMYHSSWYDYDALIPLLEPYVQQLLGLDRFLEPITKNEVKA